MKLITAAIMNKLQKNYKTGNEDDLPLKLFNASGSQTWLINRIEPDGDIMYRIADLGFGIVEWGTVSLNELLECKRKNPFRFMLERDKSWRGGKVVDFSNRDSLCGC
jgi:hypothetical protein